MKIATLSIVGVLFLYQLHSSAGIDENQKDQIQNGLKAAANLMSFLKEKNFFSLLTKISSVAGPLFSIANVALMIAFMFIDMDSPEMALMKAEFGKLNSRLDAWSGEFTDVKRKIEWSAVQISYADYENSIKTLHRSMKFITEGSRDSMELQKKIFINKYESTFLDSLDNLYYGMINTDMIFSENLFRASQKFTENHRREVQQFMTGLLQLMIQGIQVQAVYVNLKYNSTEANKFMESTWQKKLNVLKDKMAEIDTNTKDNWLNQYPKDVDYLLAKYRSSSNQNFADITLKFFPQKYFWRDWFSVSYNEISTFRTHTVSECMGLHRFRAHGRNFLISSRDKQSSRPSNQQNLLNKILNDYASKPRIYSNDWAKHVVNDLRANNNGCFNAYHVSTVQWGANVWYWHSGGVLAYKKVCVYGAGQRCFNTFLFG